MSRAEYYLALCLLDALDDQSLESLRVLLEVHKANPNAIVLEKNVAPIHLVIGVEDERLAEQMTRLMLQYGANPNLSTTAEGMTPLHVAANLGRVRLVELLLKAGGDMDLKDDELKTPVQYAVEEGHYDVIRVMQNFAFEKKFEKKREQVMQQNLSSGNGYVKCFGGYLKVATPTKNCLTAVQALDENKLTPNRIHYNFDVTSPYYINITHRRKSRTKILNDNNFESNEAIEQTENNEASDDSKEISDEEEIVIGRKNLFELTERNLADFSKNMTGTGRRTSFIECWRDKVAALRMKNDLSTNLRDIERILSGFSDNSINEEAKEDLLIERNSHTSNPESSDAEQNSCFETAVEQTILYEDSLRTNEFARDLPASPDSKNISKSRLPELHNNIVQITEEYIHTDDEAGLIFYEKKFLSKSTVETPVHSDQPHNASLSTLSTNITLPPLDYDTDTLRAELTNFGEPPGPITKHTKKLYLKKLVKYKRDPERALASVKDKHPNFSVELLSTVRSADVFHQIVDHTALETEMSDEFQTTTNNNKAWREGHLKKSFIYLLIDPRISENLPAQQKLLSPHELWKRFLVSVFYVGKGKSSRPYCHLYDAMKLYQQKSTGQQNLKPPSPEAQLIVEEEEIIFRSDERIERVCHATKILNRKQMNDSAKLNRIIDIWRSQRGVICLHVFHSIMPAEAYTREAAIIDAIGIQNLTNLKRGDYYGKTLSWPMKRRKQLGILLLYKAMLMFLAEGETQLLPSDLI